MSLTQASAGNVSLSDIIDCAENQPLVQSFSVFENNNVQGASNILSVQFSFNRELSPGLPISINAAGACHNIPCLVFMPVAVANQV